MNAAACILAALLLGSTAQEEEHRWEVAAVPTLTYNSDEGWGTGGVGTLYHRTGGVLPYKDAFTLKVFISHKLIQAHSLSWDGLLPLNLPVRAWARVGYYSTLTQNFCGFGNAVTCDPALAAAAADAAGLPAGEARERFERRYYMMRFMRPYGDAMLRYRVWDMPHRLELLAGWRGSYYLPGELGAAGPYPGSLYAEVFPQGEPGFSSAPFVGLVLDDRDHEAFPLRGYLFETSLRAAAPLTGSRWTYAGANISLSAFLGLADHPRVALALRFLGDALEGDAPTEEIARIGGTVDAIAFGGQAIGRGVREHRYLGKLKAVQQTELRAQLYDFTLLAQELSLGGALFGDFAWIGYDLRDLRGDPRQLLGGGGVSWRLLWNRDFVVRFDLAISPHEAYAPGVYVIVGNVF